MKLKFRLVKWECFLISHWIVALLALQLFEFYLLLLLFYSNNLMFLSVILCALCASSLSIRLDSICLPAFLRCAYILFRSFIVFLRLSPSLSQCPYFLFILFPHHHHHSLFSFNVTKWWKHCYKSFLQRINLSSWRLRFKWLTLNWINILRRYREKIHATITIMSCRHQQQRQRWWQWSNWKVCWMCVFVCSVHTFLFGLRPFPLRLSRFLLTKYVY